MARFTAMSLCLATILAAVALPSPARAQAAAAPADWATLPECARAKPNAPCRIVIDRTVPVSGRRAEVENETPVTLVLDKKDPFESCRNEVKREQLPDVSVVPTLLTLVKDLSASIVFPVGGRGLAPGLAAAHACGRLDADFTTTKNLVDQRTRDADALQRRHNEEATKLETFYRTRFFKKPLGIPGSTDDDAFQNERATRLAAIESLARETPTGTPSGESDYKSLMNRLSECRASQELDGAAAAAAEDEIDRLRRAIDSLNEAVAALEAARVKLRPVIAYLRRLEHAEWEAVLPLHPDRNAKLTASIGCTSDVTGKATLDPPVVVTVTFRDTPWLSLTAGVLVSRVQRNHVSIEPVVDSRTGNQATSHPEIVEHPSSPQVIPFSFLNLRLLPPLVWGAGHRLTVHASPGLGVNPNDGDATAEFFAGGSVAFDSLFLTVGWHIGHDLSPANGFRVGDQPQTSLSEVPVQTSWTAGLAFAVTYRIPIK